MKVVPNAKKFCVRSEGEKIKIKVKSAAEKGKANAELCARLKKVFEAEVKIISGHASRKKKLLVKKDLASVKAALK